MSEESRKSFWVLSAELLAAEGYDGLYSPGECGCLLSDLAPCGDGPHDCYPGVKKKCCTSECNHAYGGEDWYDEESWHIEEKKR